MPSEKSARASQRKRAAKMPLRSKAKTFVTKSRRLIAVGDLGEANQAVRDAVIALDKAAQKGAIHRNNAARRKSRIMKQLADAKRS